MFNKLLSALLWASLTNVLFFSETNSLTIVVHGTLSSGSDVEDSVVEDWITTHGTLETVRLFW